MPTIGITGGFGTGKSTVARIFSSKGARVIDADRIAHRVIKKGSGEYKSIVGIFGKDILSRKGEIDREKLAEVAFGRRLCLNRLCRIVHPAVIKRIKKQIVASRGRLVVIDAPLLIEAGLAGIVDNIIVVAASRENQIKRLRRKSGLSRRQVLRRINAQMLLLAKKRMADFIVDNDGSLTYTRRQVEKIWRQIKLKEVK